MAVVALCLVACHAGDSGVVRRGTLTLRLAGAAGNEGALLVIVSGAPVTAVNGAAGYQVATNADGAGTHVMVVGPLVDGALATIDVPDVSLAAAYVATVEQVADRSVFTLVDPVRYRVTVGP